MGAVDQAVGEALSTIWKSTRKEAKQIIVDKVILAAKASSWLHIRHVKLQRKVDVGRHPGAGRLFDKDPKWVMNYSSSRETPPAVLPNKGQNRTFQAILPFRGKILNVVKPCITKF